MGEKLFPTSLLGNFSGPISALPVQSWREFGVRTWICCPGPAGAHLALPPEQDLPSPGVSLPLLWKHPRGTKPLLSTQILEAELPVPPQIRLMFIPAANLI